MDKLELILNKLANIEHLLSHLCAIVEHPKPKPEDIPDPAKPQKI